MANLETFTNWGAAERARGARRRVWILSVVAAATVLVTIAWRFDPLGLSRVQQAPPDRPEASLVRPGMSEAQVRGVLGQPDAVETSAGHNENLGQWPQTAARLLIYRRVNTPSLKVYITQSDQVLYASQFMEFNPVEQ